LLHANIGKAMKLNSIQMLRALAALLVVYTHSITQMSLFAPSWQQRTPASIAMGTFGVDIFFVISGFIIYYTAERLNGAPASFSFLWHRFRRINPAYYAVAMITMITWIPSLLRHQRPPITGRQIISWIILLPFPGDPARVLFQAWTLSFEWLFYLLFFLLIFFRTRRKALLLFSSLSGIALLGWLLRDKLTGVMLFYTDPLLLEFGMGVIIGFFWKRWTPRKTTAFCLLLPGILLGLTFIVTGYGDFIAVPSPPAPLRYLHALSWGSAAALIVAGCVFLEKTSTKASFIRHPLVVLLGDASYSIYLVHMLVFGLIAAFYLRVGRLFIHPDVAIPVNALITIAGSLLFYKWLERPLLRWLAPPRPSPPPSSQPLSAPPPSSQPPSSPPLSSQPPSAPPPPTPSRSPKP
jgi:exopolysaccharide production protein ExoZ